jgi:hypothetical protein
MENASPDSSADPIVELFKRRMDRTMLRDNLRKSCEDRVLGLERIIAFIQQLHSPGSLPATTRFTALLAALGESGVACVIVGGVAATLHGAARITYDLDAVYDRSADNLQRIVAALAPLRAYPRDASPGMPFRLDVETLRRGTNFKFTTARGSLDLMGELAGVGPYPLVRTHALEAEIAGIRYSYLDLETLVVARRVAGRAKDLEAIAELEAIREERTALSHPTESAAGERVS